jgi:hypothetical protein
MLLGPMNHQLVVPGVGQQSRVDRFAAGHIDPCLADPFLSDDLNLFMVVSDTERFMSIENLFFVGREPIDDAPNAIRTSARKDRICFGRSVDASLAIGELTMADIACRYDGRSSHPRTHAANRHVRPVGENVHRPFVGLCHYSVVIISISVVQKNQRQTLTHPMS